MIQKFQGSIQDQSDLSQSFNYSATDPNQNKRLIIGPSKDKGFGAKQIHRGFFIGPKLARQVIRTFFSMALNESYHYLATGLLHKYYNKRVRSRRRVCL